MMDLHGFCMSVGVPVLSLTAIGVGLAGMGTNLLDMLQLGSLRQILQPVVGLVGLVCFVNWLMMTFGMGM